MRPTRGIHACSHRRSSSAAHAALVVIARDIWRIAASGARRYNARRALPRRGEAVWLRPSPHEQAVERPLSPHAQVYRKLSNMVSSILHRITGAALSSARHCWPGG